MSEEKPNQKEKINIKYEDARKFIPASVPYDKTGDYIMKALEYYHRHIRNGRKIEVKQDNPYAKGVSVPFGRSFAVSPSHTLPLFHQLTSSKEEERGDRRTFALQNG
jgi:hypothetical protein